jgi:hypothetical protein
VCARRETEAAHETCVTSCVCVPCVCPRAARCFRCRRNFPMRMVIASDPLGHTGPATFRYKLIYNIAGGVIARACPVPHAPPPRGFVGTTFRYSLLACARACRHLPQRPGWPAVPHRGRPVVGAIHAGAALIPLRRSLRDRCTARAPPLHTHFAHRAKPDAPTSKSRGSSPCAHSHPRAHPHAWHCLLNPVHLRSHKYTHAHAATHSHTHAHAHTHTHGASALAISPPQNGCPEGTGSFESA